MGDNQYTSEVEVLLKQGTKVEFKCHPKGLLYTGRIEVCPYGVFYFVNEFCYDGDVLKEIDEPMRYYNPLGTYFTYFKILEL